MFESIDIDNLIHNIELFKSTTNFIPFIFDTKRLEDFNKFVNLSQEASYAGISTTQSTVLQPHRPVIDNKGKTTFRHHIVDAHFVKVNTQYELDKIRNLWNVFYESRNNPALYGDGIDRSTWRIVHFLVDLVAKQMQTDEVNYLMYHGIRKENMQAEGTPSPAKDSTDGLRIRLNRDALTSSPLSLTIPTGAMPKNDVLALLAKIESFADNLPAHLQNEQTVIYANPSILRDYRRGYNAKYNTNYKDSDIKGMSELPLYDYPNIKLSALHCMQYSDKMIATKLGNLLRLTKKSMPMKSFKMWSFNPYEVNVAVEYSVGYGFVDMTQVVQNGEDMGLVHNPKIAVIND